MPPAAPPAAAAAAQDLIGTATKDTRNSGAAVLATSDLIVRVCSFLDSAADGASLRQVCKQSAASLDWFDLLWCAKADVSKVQRAIKHAACITVPAARIRRVVHKIFIGEVWSCPPLLKWVVLQAAKQGDAGLLEIALGRQQQQQEEEGVMQPEGSILLEREQRQQAQQGEILPTHDFTCNERLFWSAFLKHAYILEELEYPYVLERIARGWSGDSGGCGTSIWLTAIAAEEAVRSGQVKLLEQMVKQGWFEQTPVRRENVLTQQASLPTADDTGSGSVEDRNTAGKGGSAAGEGGSARNESEISVEVWNLWRDSIENPKLIDPLIRTPRCHQLGPVFLAAAAARDVEAGKLLLNYCPDLVPYALWNSPDRIREGVIMCTGIDEVVFSSEICEPWLDVLPFLSQLHRGGFQWRSHDRSLINVLLQLCHRKQRHRPESVQMLLELGLVSCNQEVLYSPSMDIRPMKGYFNVACPIIAVAVAERNAGAVAVLMAAGAVLPAPSVGELQPHLLRNLPFDYTDLQAVVSDLHGQVAAAGGGGVIGAAQYQKAADVLRGYCEEHGREKIDARALTHHH
jgi:hypothetical protein